MSTPVRHVVGVDPGKTTGVAVFNRETRKLDQWQSSSDEYADWVRWALSESGYGRGALLVVMERYTISQTTARMGRGDQEWSLELIGLTRHMARWNSHEFELQDRASAKRFASDVALRSVGLYPTGQQHAADATRQVMLARARRFQEPPPWVS